MTSAHAASAQTCTSARAESEASFDDRCTWSSGATFVRAGAAVGSAVGGVLSTVNVRVVDQADVLPAVAGAPARQGEGPAAGGAGDHRVSLASARAGNVG